MIQFPVDDEDCLTITEVTEDGKPNGKPKRLEFDRVFNQVSTQEQVFEDVSPLVHSCIQGFTVCVFAYGRLISCFMLTGRSCKKGSP